VVPSLVRLLDGDGIRVRSITLSEPSLDDVYLKKTGRSLADTADSDETGA
jgi:ABC-2 type transport system ATP-binding protein